MTCNSLSDNQDSVKEAKPDLEYTSRMTEIEGGTRSAAVGSERLVRAPKQARAHRTREKLIEAAIVCFERHGFDETTTALIATEAGVAVGTVYNHFADKREIIL